MAAPMSNSEEWGKLLLQCGGRRFSQSKFEFLFPTKCFDCWSCMEVRLHGELALQTELKASFAMPLCKDSRVIAVCIYYSRYALPANLQMEQTCLAIANEILISTFARSSHMDPGFRFTQGDHSVVDVPPSKTGASKAWQRCQAALDQRHDRTEEQMEQIIKFSKGIHFFKYITNAQRTDLCKTMQHTILKKGQMVMHGCNHEQHGHIWYVVIQGRVDMCVRTHAEGMTYRMCSFKEGDTFAMSYMKMFVTGPGVVAHIEAATEASCIVITIPEEYRAEFRTNTRPLWYEELAQYFHISINEAADALGMCMSAIKKICRRHGISRWPHRKLASVNKTVTMLQGKIASAEDDASRAALRSEAVNVLTMKLRLTINPSYLVRDESIVLGSTGPDAAGTMLPPSAHGGGGGGPGPGGPGMNPGMRPGGMGGYPGQFDDGDGPGDRDHDRGGPGGPGGGPGFPAGMEAIMRQQAGQRTLMAAQAEAHASASAAQVLHKVQTMARARQGGMGDGGGGPGGGGGMPHPHGVMGGLGPGGVGPYGPGGGMGGALQHQLQQDAMLQRSLLMAGKGGHMGPGGGGGGQMGRGGHMQGGGGPGMRGDGKDDDGHGGDGFDDPFDPQHQHDGRGRGMPGGMPPGMGPGPGGMGGPMGYGLPGQGPGPGLAHMSAAYGQGGGGGGGGMGGWQGQEAMMQQRMQEQLLQQRMQQGFGQYGMGPAGLGPGMGGGMMLGPGGGPDDLKGMQPGGQAGELGKRHGIDFLMAAGGHMDADLMEKRMRHGGL